jgi:hypothetical protein
VISLSFNFSIGDWHNSSIPQTSFETCASGITSESIAASIEICVIMM